MPRSLTILVLALAPLLSGCASPTGPATPPAAPLPDARDLAENPLDVIGLPQP